MANARKHPQRSSRFPCLRRHTVARRNYMSHDTKTASEKIHDWSRKPEREEYNAHSSIVNRDKLFDNLKYVAPDQTFQLLWLDLSPFVYFLLSSCCFQLNIWHNKWGDGITDSAVPISIVGVYKIGHQSITSFPELFSFLSIVCGCVCLYDSLYLFLPSCVCAVSYVLFFCSSNLYI